MPGTFEPLSEVPSWAAGTAVALPLSTQCCQGKGAEGKILFFHLTFLGHFQNIFSLFLKLKLNCVVLYCSTLITVLWLVSHGLPLMCGLQEDKKGNKFWINEMGEVNWPGCNAVETIGMHAFAKEKDAPLFSSLLFLKQWNNCSHYRYSLLNFHCSFWWLKRSLQMMCLVNKNFLKLVRQPIWFELFIEDP